MAEGRMNLAALQQRDPYITDIVDTATQVALYSFNMKNNEWEKTHIEGSLFVYKRSASPNNGFMILNRLGLNNLIEPITKDLEFHVQDPFLLYRNAKAIFGVWFYDKDECVRIGQLMDSLLQQALEHYRANLQRRKSESDGMQEKMEAMPIAAAKGKNVDIMQMLSKAQHEYDKTKSSTPKGVDPKPLIDNPNASAMKSTDLIRPKPLKVNNGEEDAPSEDMNQSASASAPISLETLFRNASLQQQKQQGEVTDLPKTPGFHRSISLSECEAKFPPEEPSNELPPLLKHIMSSSSMVEEIEKQQIGDAPVKNRRVKSPRNDADSVVSKFFLPTEEDKSAGQKFYRQLSLQHSTQTDSKYRLSPGGSPGDSVKSNNSGQSRDVSHTSATPRSESQTVQDLFQSAVKSPSALPVAKQPMNRKLSQTSQGSVVSGNELLTPAALEQSFSSQSSLVADVPERPASCSKIPSAPSGSDVLLTPMAFLQSSNSPSSLGGFELRPKSEPIEDRLPVAALTKEQLQQAMLYLIKNDPSFINTLHEAYLNSLKDMANLKS